MRGGAYEDEAGSIGFGFLRRPPGSLHEKSPGNIVVAKIVEGVGLKRI